MPVMVPATSAWNFTPSSTAPGSPPSTIAGTGLDGQIMKVPAVTVMLRALVTFCAPAVTRTVKVAVPAAVGAPGSARARGVRAGRGGGGPRAGAGVWGGVPPLAARVAL